MKDLNPNPEIIDAFEAESEVSVAVLFNHAAQSFDLVDSEETYTLVLDLNPQGLTLAAITGPDGAGPGVVLNPEQLEAVARRLQTLANIARLRRMVVTPKGAA